MRVGRAAFFLVVVGVVAPACGIFLGGPDEAPMMDGAGPEPDGAVADVPMMHDAVVLPETGDCDAGDTASTAFLVLAGAMGCPVGTMEENLVSSPVAGQGACTCGACTPTVQPACSGSAQWSWGSSAQCTQGPNTYNVVDGQCMDFGFTFTAVDYNGWTTLSPSAGTCTAATMPDITKVQTTPLARCVVPPQRPDILCGAKALGGYKFCVPANDGGCSAPYTQGVLAGTAPALSCDLCGCSLTASTCTVDYHGDANCTSLKYSRLVDGNCTTTGNPSGNNHFKVHPTATQCMVMAGAAKVGVAGSVRMCCTP